MISKSIKGESDHFLAVNAISRLTPPVTICRPTITFRLRQDPQAGGNTVQWFVSPHGSGQWLTPYFVHVPLLSFACFIAHSFQPRLAQGGKMTF